MGNGCCGNVIAALASFFIPGLGQLLQGRWLLAGFMFVMTALLWLILLGCVIKVFVQLELGRFTISHGQTTLSSLNKVPGPRFGRANWIVLLWGAMTLTTVGQLGGIVGGVGQALALTIPLTGDSVEAVRIPSEKNIRSYADWQLIAFGRTGHAFTNPTARMPEQGILYDERADRRSWRALEGFLAELFPPI